ncbi:MAG: hypothetical protein JSV43_03180 [Methanobacteriota archaeon]|nr:MAG: hypothetical protein JSV43_03180 [Euryarchaeota archaeon]
MQARSGHIRFDKKVKYSDLLPIYRDIFERFLVETGQIPEEEPEYTEVLLEQNLIDLRNNRKPEGYNRSGSMRMIFPICEGVEFYLYGRGKDTEVPRITELISKLLKKEGLKHSVEWDKMLLYKKK